MADWTTIPDSSIEPGKPIRSIDGLALRDNPIAIAEGAAGAPKVQPEGMAFYPAQQGGGSGMLSNKIYIGWNGVNVLLQVDSTPMGAVSTSNLSAGAVGTYAVLFNNTTSDIAFNATVAGSSLGALNSGNNSTFDIVSSFSPFFGSAQTGTWRCLAFAYRQTSFTDVGGTVYYSRPSLFLRIS